MGRQAAWCEVPGTLDALKAHWGAGLSASDISGRLWIDFQINVSRCAVLGKVHRLGLQERERRTVPRQPRVKQARSQGNVFQLPKSRGPGSRADRLQRRKLDYDRIQTVPIPDDDTFSPPHTRKSLLDLGVQECHWPYGSGPFMFCAKPAEKGPHPYCRYHNIVHSHGPQAAAFFCQAAE